ncbi:MAG: GNAT family N-acetyltransferase [Myxococcaceae bacterium]
MAVTIRPASLADAQLINDIYNPYVHSSTCTLQLEPTTLEERQAWMRNLSPKHPVIIAEENGVAVGWGSLVPFHVRPGYRFSVENSVYVREGFHGRGVGQAIMTELIASARSSGFHLIVARISSDQTSSVKLHERFGFTHAGTLHEVGTKFGRWTDVSFYELRLSDRAPPG